MLQTVQALRAAACLLVVAYHADGGRWPNGAAGVDLFFVISGLVMQMSSAGLAARVFMVHRLRRLVPLYWTLSAAKLAIGLVWPATLAVARPGAWNMVASFLFIPARDGAGLVRPLLGVGWTLQFEMLFYVLFAGALALRRRPAWVVLPILGALTIAGFWRVPAWPAALTLANGLVAEFGFGMILAMAAPCLAGLKPPVGWLLVLLGAIFLLAGPSGGAWRFVFWGLPAAAIVAGALVLEAPLRGRLPRIGLVLGDSSYAIYLVHPFLVPVLVVALGRAPIAVVVVASLVTCALAGWLVHHWFDEKVQARLRRGVWRLRFGSAAGRPAPSAQLVEP
jgi:exopolysaccharide production protein ExoZ